MSIAVERNLTAQRYVEKKLEYYLSHPVTLRDEDTTVQSLVVSFVKIKQMGFRGIVLTAIVGRYLDNSYDPVANFYDCNPRSIFEKGIKLALDSYKIPCGKSDPLNVAKNATVIDENWARGKRPENAALAVVKFLSHLNKFHPNSDEFEHLVAIFFTVLLELKREIESLEVAMPDLSESSLLLAETFALFACTVPEGGKVPQFFFGSMLEELRKSQGSRVKVFGVDESVYSTNTTAKKPGDIWEQAEEEISAVYEVTVKVIDKNRLEDCYQNLCALGLQDKAVKFVCNVPDNIRQLTFEGTNNVLVYKNIVFEFLSLYHWLLDTYINLPPENKSSFAKKIFKFMNKYSRAVETKNRWNQVIEKFGES